MFWFDIPVSRAEAHPLIKLTKGDLGMFMFVFMQLFSCVDRVVILLYPLYPTACCVASEKTRLASPYPSCQHVIAGY